MSVIIVIRFVLWIAFIYFGLGALFQRMAPPLGTVWRFFVLSTLGFALVTVFSMAGYLWGLPLRLINLALGVAAAFGVCRFATAEWRKLKHGRLWLRALLMWTAALGIMLAPFFAGGNQFALFQGNHHDTYTYLEAAATYAHIPKDVIITDSVLGLVSKGGFGIAQANFHFRPEVSVVYGALQYIAPSGFLGLHYIFLCYSSFLAAGMLAVISKFSIPATPPWLAEIFGFAFGAGFWGQYILDINAWSQVAWMPLELLLVLLWFREIAGASGQSEYRAQPIRLSLVPLALTAIGAFYVYPEGFLFFAPPLVVATIVGARKAMIGRIASLIFFSLLAAIPFVLIVWNTNVTMVLDQLNQATAGNDWWKYFQAPLFGLDGINRNYWSDGLDGLAGAFGVYFLTPSAGASAPLSLSWRILLLVWFLALAAPLFVGKKRVPDAANQPLVLISVLVGLLLVQCGWLCHKAQYWSAGKGLSFLSPFLFLLVAAPAFGATSHRSGTAFRASLCALGLLLSSQVYFSLLRIRRSADEAGIHYQRPYPAIQGESLKQSFCFGDTEFLRGLRQTDEVAVQIDNPWVESFVCMHLLANQIPFFPELPVRENRYSERRLGSVVPARAPTVRLSVNSTGKPLFPIVVAVQRLHP